jgi:hypothetical protein
MEVGASMYVVGKSTERQATAAEADVMRREGFPEILHFQEYDSVLIGNTRYKSVNGQNADIRSNDTCIFTEQNTYCTIQKVIGFTLANGQQRYGLIVLEHEIQFNHPIARHLSIVRPDGDGDLLHFIHLNQVRCPAVTMSVDNVKYVAAIPNCFEID